MSSFNPLSSVSFNLSWLFLYFIFLNYFAHFQAFCSLLVTLSVTSIPDSDTRHREREISFLRRSDFLNRINAQIFGGESSSWPTSASAMQFRIRFPRGNPSESRDIIAARIAESYHPPLNKISKNGNVSGRAVREIRSRCQVFRILRRQGCGQSCRANETFIISRRFLLGIFFFFSSFFVATFTRTSRYRALIIVDIRHILVTPRHATGTI